MAAVSSSHESSYFVCHKWIRVITNLNLSKRRVVNKYFIKEQVESAQVVLDIVKTLNDRPRNLGQVSQEGFGIIVFKLLVVTYTDLGRYFFTFKVMD